MIEALDGLMNLDACGANFTVRDSECRNLRYRGILVRTHHGLIENNLLTGLGNDGISLTAHPFGEGPYSQDIIVRHNRIRQIGMLPYGGLGGIGVGIRVGVSPEMRWDGPPGSLTARTQQRIVIEDNDIADTTGDAIQIASAQDVVLRRNRIEGVAVRRHQAFDRWRPIPIRVLNAEAVVQEQNQILGAAAE